MQALELTVVESFIQTISPGTVYQRLRASLGPKQAPKKPTYDQDDDYSI